MTSKDRAFVLRRKPLGEADVLLTLYSEKNGKVRVVAKGARRITSKLLGFTELFTVVTCQIDFRTSIPVVSQIAHEQIYDGIADNHRTYEQLHLVAELIDRGCEEQEPNPELFRFLLSSVHELVVANSVTTFPYTLLMLISILGFSPQLLLCAACGDPLLPDQVMRWSEVHGGVVSCTAGGEGSTLSLDEVKLLRYLSRSSMHEVQKVSAGPEVIQRIGSLLTNHAQYVLDRNFSSVKASRG